MASPFEFFRKNQRLWMAGAVLVAIVAFVIAPMLEYFIGSQNGARGANPIVAAWNGGSIRHQQLERDESDLSLVNRFLRELATTVMSKGGMPGVPGFSPDLSTVGVSPPSTIAVVERHLYASEAARLGIHFDDSVAKTFLQRFVDGRLSGSEIQAIMLKSTDRRLSMPLFTRILRDELTYQELRRLTTSGLAFADIRDAKTVGYPILTTPSKNWREYLRISKSASIKAYPVPVRDFLDQVTATPTDTELRAIYEAGKTLVRNENMLDTQPAFMRPATADIEFASVNVDKILEAEIAKIPEDILRDEYERRVLNNEFRIPIEFSEKDLENLQLPPSTPAEEGTEQSDAPASDTDADNADSTPQETDAQPPADGSDPQSSRQVLDSKIRLVAFQEDEETQPVPAEEAPAEEVPTGETQSDEPSGEPKAEETPSTEEQPATEDPASAEPAAQEPDAAAEDSASEDAPANETSVEQASEPTTTMQIGEQPELEPGVTLPDTPSVAPLRTRSFDEVKDQIARELAMEPAMQIANERIENVYAPMSVYKSELASYSNMVRMQGASGLDVPVRPNLAELAQEFGLEHGTTGTVDSKTVLLNPIGASVVRFGSGQNAQQFTVADLVAAASGIGEPLNAMTSSSQNGESITRFVFWKTAVELPQTPSFETVREQVAEVWKIQEAQKLAESKAKEIAGRIGSGQIEDVLSTEEEKKMVVQPAPFTAVDRMYPMFLQFSPGAGIPEASRVDLLQPVDPAFMDAVFRTPVGESTVAPDQRRSVYYVVKVLETSPSTEDLLTAFGSSPKESVAAMVNRENNAAIQSYRNSIFERLGFREYQIPGLE